MCVNDDLRETEGNLSLENNGTSFGFVLIKKRPFLRNVKAEF